MKGIKIGVIVKKQFGNIGKTSQQSDNGSKQISSVRVADPEAHQKFVNNLFSAIKS